jgi:hypothetical protein
VVPGAPDGGEVSVIEAEAVAATQAAVAAFPPNRRRAEMDGAGEQQPDLQSFLFDATGDLSGPAQELGGYVFFVIHEAFRGRNGRLPVVKTAAIVRRLDENQRLLERLGAQVFEKAAEPGEVTAQPALFSYMVGIVFGQNAAEPEIEGDEQGTLFLVLKTVIDVLDEARQGSA